MLLPLLKRLGVTVIEDPDFYVLEELGEAGIARFFREAVKLS